MMEEKKVDIATDSARDLLEGVIGHESEHNTVNEGTGSNYENKGAPQQISNPQVSEGITPTIMPSSVVGQKANHSIIPRGTNADVPPSAKKEFLSSTVTNRGGLTMYERSMLQKEERERKMKALEERLMMDFTFTPTRISSGNMKNNCGNSMVSSLGSSSSTVGGTSGGNSVFSRLYVADTAASRAQRYRTPTRNSRSGRLFATSTPKSAAATTVGRSLYSAASRSTCTVQTASPRLEALYKSGQDKLRARSISDKDESEKTKRRIDDKALNSPGAYTFRPQTKWNLVAQRRKMADEEIELQADEARRFTPKIIKAEREQKRLLDEESMEECTFQPKVKWDLIQERHDKSSKYPSTGKTKNNKKPLSRSERDKLARGKRYEEELLKECTFKPKLDWRKNDEDDNKFRYEEAEQKIVITAVSPQLVSNNNFQERLGKEFRIRTTVRRDMVGDIEGPKSPGWKKKFRQKTDIKNEFIAQGRGDGISLVRGNTLMSVSTELNFECKQVNVGDESKGAKSTATINSNDSGDDIDTVNEKEIIDSQSSGDKDLKSSETISTDDVPGVKKTTKTKTKKWLGRLAKKGNKKNTEDEKKVENAKKKREKEERMHEDENRLRAISDETEKEGKEKIEEERKGIEAEAKEATAAKAKVEAESDLKTEQEEVTRLEKESNKKERIETEMKIEENRKLMEVEAKEAAATKAKAETEAKSKLEQEEVTRLEQDIIEMDRIETKRKIEEEKSRIEKRTRIEVEAKEAAAAAKAKAEAIEKSNLEQEEVIRLEQVRIENERIETKRKIEEEKSRIEKRTRIEVEAKEAAAAAKAKAEAEEKSKLEQEEVTRLEQVRIEKERIAAKRKIEEKSRIEERKQIEVEAKEAAAAAGAKAKAEAEAKSKLEHEEMSRLEKERIKKERIEWERQEAERHELDRIERWKTERLELELIERQRREKEKFELERIEIERNEGLEKARIERINQLRIIDEEEAGKVAKAVNENAEQEKKKAEEEAVKAKVNERDMEKKLEEAGVNAKAEAEDEDEKEKTEVEAASKVEADKRELEKKMEEAAVNAKAEEAADEADRRAKLKLEQEELVRLELETIKKERIKQEHQAERQELELIERQRREKERSEFERIEIESSSAIAEAEKVAAVDVEEKRIREEETAHILALENEKEQRIEAKAKETERQRREKEKFELERIELERSLAIVKAEKVAAAAIEENRIHEEEQTRILASENEKEQQHIEVKAEETWSEETLAQKKVEEEAIAKAQAEVKRKMKSSDDERLEEEVLGLKEEKSRLQPPNRVSKWMARLKFKPDNNSDLSSNAATVGENNSNAFPKVLFDDGGEVDSRKEPEIGSI